eukprot:COSAG04_NODE_2572_length_3910_cov_1.770401_1_plen_202_part_00
MTPLPLAQVHYAIGGKPLSVLEIHTAWVGGRWETEVEQVQGDVGFRVTDPEGKSMPIAATTAQDVVDTFDPDTEFWIFNRHRVGDYYAHVNWPLADGRTLSWVDERTPPRLVANNAAVKGGWGADAPETVWVSERSDVEWSVDQVRIELALDDGAWAGGTAVTSVVLSHTMPNLEELRVKIDGSVRRPSPHSSFLGGSCPP